ncbi:Hypothetical_protein [Hexamita inflata]|uniref:Hypothetical_protein n=1 Tax=Hexamita inflata TaxID=28002 RepID=A0AA86PCM6_9EUKA|nr:Hypothetical protein HINF_LOCUS23713 [Hexamita inflata]
MVVIWHTDHAEMCFCVRMDTQRLRKQMSFAYEKFILTTCSPICSTDRQVETKIALQNIINILVQCFYLQYIFHDNTRRVLSPSSNHRTCIPGAICEAFIQLHK